MTEPTIDPTLSRSVTRPLLAGLDPDAGTLPRLRDRLVERAHAERLLDLAFTTLATPVGSLLVVASEEGLVRVAYDCEGHDRVLQELAARLSPRILRDPSRLGVATAQLEEYFAGTRRHFTLALDLRLARGFRRQVLDRLLGIDYGHTASYAAVAAAAGSPRAVRAVGSACAGNPLPVVVPCHRVVRSDGSVGQYVGGSAAKRELLRRERQAA